MVPDSVRAFALCAELMGESAGMMKKTRIPENTLAKRMGTDFLVVKLTVTLIHR